MRIAYLDCFSGISGDMFLGALVDAGVSVGLLEETVRARNVGARGEVTKVVRSGIAAAKVDVWVGDEKEGPAEAHSHGHSHQHSHSHSDGGPKTDRSGADGHEPHHREHGRSLSEI